MNECTNKFYVLSKGDVFFVEGTATSWLGKTTGGKTHVLISLPSDGVIPGNINNRPVRLFSIEKDRLAGITDIAGTGKYIFSYMAAEDQEIELFGLSGKDDAASSIISRKELIYAAVCTLSDIIGLSFKALNSLRERLDRLCDISGAMAMFLCAIGEKLSLALPEGELFIRASAELGRFTKNTPGIPKLGENFVKAGQFARFETSQLSDKINGRISYYTQLKTIPQELTKYFFGYAPFVMEYHLREGYECTASIKDCILSALGKIGTALEALIYNEDSLFKTYLHAAESMHYNPAEAAAISEAAEYAWAQILEIVKALNNDSGLEINAASILEELVKKTKKAAEAHAKTALVSPYSGQNLGNINEELSDSAIKILNYAAVPKDQVRTFLAALESFKSLNDKMSADSEAKNIRKKVTTMFFDIYKSVSRRALQENAVPKLIRMFLNFGYMDENLVSSEQLAALYKVVEEFGSGPQQSVFNMHQWLSEIYNKSKSPSINEFGQDYFDVFREMRRQGTVSDKEKQEYDNNLDGRMDFEVENMLRTNQKLCYGQISTYFPLLHKDMISRDIDSSIVTPARIQGSIDRILEMDYSAFCREVSYRNNEYGIEKEFVMKAVQPDIVLMPTFGSRGVMWQEISDRNRRLPGRFILPILTAENLDEMIARLIGNFRWELCRTMMGAGWNDITQKSLTSEYTDYIQFFKKNSELHEEAKEKIRVQILKHRSMMRDIFTSDYEIWLNYESKGMIRLNKAARSIFYRYCPFSREIRSQLEKQPAYAEPAALFNIQKARMARDLENRYSRLIKSGVPLDQELKDNLEYYKEK